MLTLFKHSNIRHIQSLVYNHRKKLAKNTIIFHKFTFCRTLSVCLVCSVWLVFILFLLFLSMWLSFLISKGSTDKNDILTFWTFDFPVNVVLPLSKRWRYISRVGLNSDSLILCRESLTLFCRHIWVKLGFVNSGSISLGVLLVPCIPRLFHLLSENKEKTCSPFCPGIPTVQQPSGNRPLKFQDLVLDIWHRQQNPSLLILPALHKLNVTNITSTQCELNPKHQVPLGVVLSQVPRQAVDRLGNMGCFRY